jgi:hypothetical protein
MSMEWAQGPIAATDDPLADSAVGGHPGASEHLDNDDLERVMQEVPRGAFALAALAVGVLLVGWLLVYFLVFLPRGMVS